jgi:Fe-S-cluster containining protein
VCGGECCQYFILDYQRPDMGIPRFKDTLDWIGRHKDTIILEQDLARRWARIRINVPCSCLDESGRCWDYENRPLACRAYVCHDWPQRMSKIVLKEQIGDGKQLNQHTI